MRLPPYPSPSPVSYLALYFEAAMLAFEAQQVMALRMMRLWTGGAAAEAEMSRMISEKATAARAAGLGVMAGLAAGQGEAEIARRAVRGYRRRVGVNRRRLVRTAG